jgi:hypothetical protein
VLSNELRALIVQPALYRVGSLHLALIFLFDVRPPSGHITEARSGANECCFGQQIRTELEVGSSLPMRDHANPNSIDRYKVPALSTTAIVEPFVAMQPVSAIPLVHVGKPCSTGTMSPSGLIGRR